MGVPSAAQRAKVDKYLLKHTAESPVGTYHLTTSTELPPPHVVRYAIILRILRYVSPFPWGSPDAEAHRQWKSISQISNALWPYDTQEELDHFLQYDAVKSRKRFTAGGMVLWQPTPTLTIPILPRFDHSVGDGIARPIVRKAFGWLAQRQPPYSRQHGHRSPNASTIDVTAKLLSRSPFNIVWDLRWLIEFSENAIDLLCKDRFKPKNFSMVPPIGEHFRYILTPGNQWWQPAVVLEDSRVLDETSSSKKGSSRNVHLALPGPMQPGSGVKMTFIRTIDAI
ncbi:hypothetical protein FRC17_007215 [Serendipita sp. 399]|nr:hypothetical protein FRC17_007215 [Serendipita sp. 399]